MEFTEGISYPNLVMGMGLAEIKKDARDFFSSKEGVKCVSAAALITDSIFKVTLANFFLKVTRPPIPARLFTNKAKAIKWLQQFK